MSGFFDDLEAQLLGAARAELARRGPQRTSMNRGARWRRGFSPSGVLTSALVLIGLGVAGLILALVHPAAHPNVHPAAHPNATAGAPTPLGYVNTAEAAVAQRNPKCRDLVSGVIAAGRPTQLLKILGVIGRPAGSGQVLPLATLPGPAVGIERALYARYVRRVRVAAGIDYYFAPIVQGRAVAAPRECRTAQLNDVRAELAAESVSSTVRRSVIAVTTQILANQVLLIPPTEHLLSLSANVTSRGASLVGGDLTAAQILAGQGHRPIITLSRPPGTTVMPYVVPDGVASVIMYFPPKAFKLPTSFPHGLTVSAQAVNNAAFVFVRGDLVRNPENVIWRSASGSVIRTIRCAGC